MGATLRRFRKSVVVFYWIVLVFLIVVSVGWITSLILSPGSAQNWLFALGSTAMTALVAWRLWLNRRALGRVATLPGRKRLLVVFLPLGLLAVFGAAMTCCGLVWTGIAIWIAVDDTVSMGPVPVAGPLSTGIIGLATAGIGVMMVWPFAKRLRYRPPAHETF